MSDDGTCWLQSVEGFRPGSLRDRVVRTGLGSCHNVEFRDSLSYFPNQLEVPAQVATRDASLARFHIEIGDHIVFRLPPQPYVYF